MMHYKRLLLAVIATPLALSLAACSSNSTLSNITGQSASIRYVNGSPDIGTIDLYFVPSGQTLGATAQLPTAAYGLISDFQTEPTTAGQVFAYPAGSKTTPSLSCAIPQLSNNGLYTVVISGQVATKTLQCTLFNDATFNANGQVRVHHASPAAANAGLASVAYGFYAPPFNAATPIGVAGNAAFPGFLGASGTPQSSFVSTAVATVSSTSQPIGVAVGSNPGNASTTFNGALGIDASKFVNPGTTTQADTAGTIPGSSYINGSVFAIDCGANATTPQGTTCANGIGLIGTFDSK